MKLDIKAGSKIKLFYNENNINNRIIYIRAIVDDDNVVFKVWSKGKRRWNYFIEDISYFEINSKYMTNE